MSRPNRRLLLVRDPFDAISSYFRLRQANVDNPYVGEFSDFLRSRRYGMSSYVRHFKSWATRSGPIVFYEDFFSDPASTILGALGEIGCSELDEDAMHRAVAQATMERTQKRELEGGVRDAGRFQQGFRVTGGSLLEDRRALFGPSDATYISEALRATPALSRFARERY